tara:strand:- start:92 stop:238 length:147 start_codon:yes stop_codon:yes gene_type:complete
MNRELMMQALEQFMFDHDWLDTDVVALLEDEDIPYTRNDKEITHDTDD